MTTTAPSPNPVLDQFLLGARMCLPVCISVAAYGIVWGVLARQAGMTMLEALLMSGLVFAGAAQFVAAELWNPDALPVGALIVAALIVNLRFLLLTATLRPLFTAIPAWRGALAMWAVSDENWAMTMGEIAKGRGSVAFLMGGGALAYVSWLTSNTAGYLLGSAIDDPARYGLDFAFTATFLALLLGTWKGKSDLVPWIVAAGVAASVSRFVPGTWHILAGGILGSLAGTLWDAWRRKTNVS